MIIERQLENQILSGLTSLSATTTELSTYQFVSSRQTGEMDESPDTNGVIAVTVAFRQHDAFSLSPISVPCSISIVSKVETNPTGEIHEAVVEAIADWLSFLHRFPDAMQAALEGDKFMAGELRLTGGTGRILSKDDSVWTESIQFTVRGAEKFDS